MEERKYNASKKDSLDSLRVPSLSQKSQTTSCNPPSLALYPSTESLSHKPPCCQLSNDFHSRQRPFHFLSCSQSPTLHPLFLLCTPQLSYGSYQIPKQVLFKMNYEQPLHLNFRTLNSLQGQKLSPRLFYNWGRLIFICTNMAVENLGQPRLQQQLGR